MCIIDISLQWRMRCTWIFITTCTEAFARETYPNLTITTVFSCHLLHTDQSSASPLALTILSRYTLGYRSWKPHQGGNWNLQRFNWFPLRGVLFGLLLQVCHSCWCQSCHTLTFCVTPWAAVKFWMLFPILVSDSSESLTRIGNTRICGIIIFDLYIFKYILCSATWKVLWNREK